MLITLLLKNEGSQHGVEIQAHLPVAGPCAPGHGPQAPALVPGPMAMGLLARARGAGPRAGPQAPGPASQILISELTIQGPDTATCSYIKI